MSWSPFSSSAHGGREGGREGEDGGMGEGADTVPLGTFSPSLSFSLSFFLLFFRSFFFFFKQYTPFENNHIRGSQMFLGVMAVAEISR